MNYNIITDRFEIEKMAEDLFLSDDKPIVHIDYADIRTIKKYGTLKQAIICDVDLQNENWAKEYVNLIQARELQLENLRALVLYLIEGGEECTVTHHEVSGVFQFLQSMTFSEEKQSNYVDILWSARTRESMPQKRLKIQLLLAYEKTEQDKQEDEKYEQMIEEYRKPFFRPLDFLEIITTPNDNQ